MIKLELIHSIRYSIIAQDIENYYENQA